MHRVIARRIRSEPALVDAARAPVEQWLETGAVHASYARAWQALLSEPVERIAAAIVEDSESARALRQASPFAGVLTARERWIIHREVARALG